MQVSLHQLMHVGSPGVKIDNSGVASPKKRGSEQFFFAGEQ